MGNKMTNIQNTVWLYGDNSECVGQIDAGTLVREWHYFSQFPTILGPCADRQEALRSVDTGAEKRTEGPSLRLV